MASDLSAYIVSLYEGKGSTQYGSEAVTQLEHALQCAALAEAEGAGTALVAASLLHDLGHLMTSADTPLGDIGTDDKHEYRALHFLRRHFGEAVLAPVRLHVAAKRYLCAADPPYTDTLSKASRLSLQLQGGPYTRLEAAEFIAQPHAIDAVRLRCWDDRAKIPGAVTPDLHHFLNLLLRCSYER